MQTVTQRNYALDVLKCLAALMVVFLHYNKVEGEYGVLYSEIVRSITRVAVPLFFMITGYYLPVIMEKGGQKRQIKKVLRLALGSTLFYLTYRLVDAYFTSSVAGWLASSYTVGTVFSWLVLNDDPTGYHLWYLYGLLYSLIFYAGLYKFKLQRYIPHITILLFLVVLVANYTEIVFVRNYLLGIPCIGCGIMVREHKLKIKFRNILFPLSITLVIAEMFYSLFYLDLSLDVYTFSIPLALCLLTWAIDNPAKGQGTPWAVIGMRLSAYIYIFHVFVDNITGIFVNYDTTFMQILHPLILFVATTAFSYIYVKSKTLISHGA